MKHFFIPISLLIPAGLLLLARFFPHLDHTIMVPLLHFYVVTFFTFAAAVVALFTAAALGKNCRPRHQLLAVAFAVMGALFFVHGVTTPGALIVEYNPGIRWAAWLTLFLGGVIFFLAGLDTPGRPLTIQKMGLIRWSLALFCAVFALIVAFAPHWLAAVDARVSPWNQQLAYGATFVAWLAATGLLTRTWRQTGDRVDGVMGLIAAWFTLGTVSLHSFPTWHVSWWLYHGQLLAGVVAAVWVLVLSYERLRQFRPAVYYAALGIIVTGGLSLLAAHLVGNLVEYGLMVFLAAHFPSSMAEMMASPEVAGLLVSARRGGLVVTGLSMGLLFFVLLAVVQRADGLVRRRTEELGRAYADLQAAEAMRDDLTGMIVHDLRTPLTAMNLNVGLLEKIIDRPDQQERRQRLLSSSRTSITNMLGLVDQILDVARMEAGQLPVNREPLPLSPLLADRARLHALLAEADDKQIVLEACPELPPVAADSQLIARVLDNLIGNAVKFTPSGGQVRLRAEGNGAGVVVQVADTGRGIDPETADHIFDKFYQATDGRGRPVHHGTGIGLTFCKLVVESHHGKIWVDSRPGEGSTFSFTLPYASGV